MADLTITAANVLSAGTSFSRATAGVALTQGEVIYLDSADGNLAKLADASAAATATIAGIVVTEAAAAQPVLYVKTGAITIGDTVATGTVYVVSATAGKIAPIADLSSTEIVSVLGIASSTTVITMNVWNTAIIKA